MKQTSLGNSGFELSNKRTRKPVRIVRRSLRIQLVPVRTLIQPGETKSGGWYLSHTYNGIECGRILGIEVTYFKGSRRVLNDSELKAAVHSEACWGIR